MAQFVAGMAAAGFSPPKEFLQENGQGGVCLIGATWLAAKGRRQCGRLCVGLDPDGVLVGGYERAREPALETRSAKEMVAWLQGEAARDE